MTDDVARALRGVPLLGGLSDRELGRVAKDFTERIIPAGSPIVKEGEEKGVGFFVITEGEASVSFRGKEITTLALAITSARSPCSAIASAQRR